MSLTDGLVLHLPFDERKGAIAYDHSSCRNDGTIAGATWKRTATGLWVLSFDGVNDFVDCGNNASLKINDTITLEAWIKYNDYVLEQQIISKAMFKSYLLSKRDSDYNYRLQTFIYTDSWKDVYSNGLSWENNQWYHVCYTYNGNIAYFYRNNVPVGSMEIVGSLTTNSTANVEIGKCPTYGQHHNGIIDEVHIYNRALSPAEISELYALGPPGGSPGEFAGHSLYFVGIDLSNPSYSLVVSKHAFQNLDLTFETVKIPGRDGAYTSESEIEPRSLSLECSVLADSKDALQTKLNKIKKAITTRTPDWLILQVQPDKYYNAKLDELATWEYKGNRAATGTIDFICPDPFGYDVEETELGGSVGSFPYTFPIWFGDLKDITTLGTAFCWPIFTMIVNQTIAQGTAVKIKNIITDDELTITVPVVGGWLADDIIEVDCYNATVKRNGSVDMGGVTGMFPYLTAGFNRISFTAFTGAVNIKYRNRWL